MPFSSIVWQFFNLKADGIVECRICNHHLKRSHRSTTNLIRHVKVKHPIELEIEEEKRKPSTSAASSSTTSSSETPQSSDGTSKTDTVKSDTPKLKQPTVLEAVERHQKYRPDDRRKQEIDDLIVNMIIQDTRPMSIVEDEGFLKLIKYLNPRYEMIARSTIRDKRLPSMYMKQKGQLKKELSEVQSVSVTTDSWTSNATESYTTITAHYIDGDWKQKSKVLSTRSEGKTHTSENLAQELLDCFKEFEIEDKVNYIVTDNASNITKAASQLKTHHPCLAHTLNLAVKDALKETETQKIIAKVKSIVKHFKHSSKQVGKLKAVHAQKNTTFIKLKQECDTRWNSTLDMLESYINQHEEITAVLCTGGKANLCLITNDETDEVEEIKNIIKTLKPMKEATTELAGEHFTTISKVIPMITALKRVCAKQTTPLAVTLSAQLSFRFDSLVSADYLEIAAALDPRFKNRSAEATAFKKIKTLLPALETETEAMIPTPETNETSYWQEWDVDIDKEQSQVSNPSELELQYYVKMPNLHRTSNPLMWWDAQSHALPEMSKLARQYLSIPATSVPSERIFSKAGEIISKRRSSLKPKHVDMLIFLNKNI